MYAVRKTITYLKYVLYMFYCRRKNGYLKLAHCTAHIRMKAIICRSHQTIPFPSLLVKFIFPNPENIHHQPPCTGITTTCCSTCNNLTYTYTDPSTI